MSKKIYVENKKFKDGTCEFNPLDKSELLIYENDNSLTEHFCYDLIELSNTDSKNEHRINSVKINDILIKTLILNYDKYKTINSLQGDREQNDKKSLNLKIDKNNFIKIPNKIDASVNKTTSHKIPKNIIQIYDKSSYLHPVIYNNVMKILKINPEYTYIFITDNEAKELIKKHFDNNTLNTFLKLRIGAAKADFIRYLALYVYGGIYLDLDSDINTKLIDFIPTSAEFIFFHNFDNDPKITQWIIMVEPNHIIIKKIIGEMIRRINNGETNIFIATGPTLFTDVIYNHINNTNIYNFKNIFSDNERRNFLEQLKLHEEFMNGLFYKLDVYRHCFKFRFEDYRDHMIYSNNEKYSINCNIFEDSVLKLKDFVITKHTNNIGEFCSILLKNEKCSENKNDKNIGFIWFLNNYDEEIIFCNEYKIKPKMGTLILFPSSCHFQYQEINTNDKAIYIIKGYF